MRQLSFKSFLSGYVYGLSERKSLNIRKLCKEMEHNHRLKEPLFLYCQYANKAHILLKCLDDAYKQEFIDVMNTLALFGKDALPIDYSKVFHSYDCEINKSKRNDELKRLLLDKIIIQQNKKGISNYKIYNTLRLNPSNVNFFLKNRNTSKLSLSNVEKIYDFVKTYHNK